MDQDAPEETDPCFLALTRPVLFGGVPMEAMALTVIVGMIGFLIFGWKCGVAGFGIYVVCRALTRWDHNFFNVCGGWLRTVGIQRNRKYWGGSSSSPARVVATYTDKDFGDE